MINEFWNGGSTKSFAFFLIQFMLRSEIEGNRHDALSHL